MNLAAIRRVASALPEVAEQPHHGFGSFRVRGKIFVTMPPGGQHVHVFLPDAIREPALAMYPRFLTKLMWGGKAVGVRIALADASPAVVEELLRQAWAAKAPRALVAKATRG